MKLGLGIDDLEEFGLVYLQQYGELFNGIPQKEAGAIEQRLGITKERLLNYVDANEEKPVAVVAAPEPTPLYQQQQPQYVPEPKQEPRVVYVEKIHHTPHRRVEPKVADTRKRIDKFARHGLLLQ